VPVVVTQFDVAPRGVDQRHVHMLKVFGWRVVDCRIGPGLRA
jgi:hypothetical protein